MPLRSGVSPWTSRVAASKRPSFPRLRGEREADVVVIGGGLTGCATAYQAAVAGFTPLLLEAARIGHGGTAIASGLLLPEPGPSFREVARAHGLRAARRVFGAWRRSALDAAALLRRLRVRCSLEPLDALLTGDHDAERELRREYEARVGAGLDVTWLAERHARALSRTDEACAIRQAGAFALDPYRACVGLATAARARGAELFEDSPATKIRVGRKQVEIQTDGGVVRAGTVIVVTGRPTALYSPLRRHFVVREGYRVLTEPVAAAVRKQVLVPSITLRDSHDPPHRLHWTDDHRVLIAGVEQAETPLRRRDALLRHWTFELMYEFLKKYPAIAGLQPAFAWRVTSSAARDGLPFIGSHRNYPRHLFAFGDTESLTGSFLAARILVRALDGTPGAADEAFAFTR